MEENETLKNEIKHDKWTEEDVSYLKSVYTNKDISVEYISKELNISKSGIYSKARSLGLKKIHRWTEEEISYLKTAYVNEGASIEEISKTLELNEACVKNRVFSLGLKREIKREILADGYKRCSKCKTIALIEDFYKGNSACKVCVAEYKKNRKKGEVDKLKKVCKSCGKEKEMADFSFNKTMKDNRENQCKRCKYEKQIERINKRRG